LPTSLGPGKLLRRAIEADRLFSSIILWGPPGTGKTTLAECKRFSCAIVANQTKCQAMHSIAPRLLSAVLAGKAELRQALIFSAVIDAALERRKLYQKKTILFVRKVLRTLNYPGFY
jgi:putative ATPase